MIDLFLYLKQQAGGAGLESLEKIGTLTSGGLMTNAFNAAGKTLFDVLDTHVAILTDMGKTFEAAGRAYLSADHASADNFRYQNTPMPTTARDLGLKPPGKKSADDVDDDTDLPDDLNKFKKDTGKAKQGVDVSIEHKEWLGWKDLYDLGQAMKPGPYASAGDMWKWVGDQIERHASDFHNNIVGLSGSWSSPNDTGGVQAAQNAVKTYVTDLGAIADVVKTTGELLNYTANWMKCTAECMPQTPKEPPHCRSQMGDYRDEWQQTYHDPLQDTAATLPVICSPTMLPPQKPSDDKGGKDNGGKDNGGKDNGGKDNGGKDNGGKDNTGGDNGGKDNTGGANTGGANAGGANTGGANTGGANTGSQYKPPNIPPLQNTPDPHAANPAGSNPNGTNPSGQNPNGANPSGTNPNSGVPGTSVPQASNTSSGGSSGQDGLSSIAGMLSSLASAGSTGLQGLSSLGTTLQQLQSALGTGDIAKLAEALGVPQDTVTNALTALEGSPDKLNELKQLLGLPTDTAQPAAALPGDTTPAGGAAIAPASGQVVATPSIPGGVPPLTPGGVLPLAPGALPFAPEEPSFTNLFSRAGLDGELAQPVLGVAAAPAAAVMTEGVTAGAEPAPVDFVDSLAHTLEAHAPVIES
ncbi:hypothetical protein ACFXG4_09190 [Nocardia sp. NPDC059246]|uniref:hypothetical protein n=1 Tax=unclassified Nocardia TaxID=2637762 RepID=UPI00367CE733